VGLQYFMDELYVSAEIQFPIPCHKFYTHHSNFVLTGFQLQMLREAQFRNPKSYSNHAV
jgi:hypothetical protein